MRDTHFYIGLGVFIFLVATALCYFGKIDATTWANVTEWDVMSVCGGGAFAALRGITIGGSGGTPGVPKS